jgi:formylglycine-generating enzyme required for sulfatase activity
MDKKDLLPGQTWEREIPKAVQEADVVLTCLSPHFVSEVGYGHREIRLALDTADLQPEGTIFIIPLRLESCDVPERLQRWHWCDYFEAESYDLLLRSLFYRAKQLGITVQSEESPTLPPPVIRTRLNPLFPVTIAEWREELTRCKGAFGKPSGYWCYVRPGHYLIGGWGKGKAVETITLPGFWIAKHPITVQQYRQFIQAGGYTSKSYWTPNGWKWKESEERTQPYGWGDERFSDDNQPVIGVTWYEATAFAAWLNGQLADVLTPGHTIRLPTEAEWEAAVAYDTAGCRRTYPWGEQEPTRDLADFNDGSDPDRPAPVGKNPMGAAACGAEEMVGSVWEVTNSSYGAYPLGSGISVRDFSPTSTDVPLRGGAWYISDTTYIRCYARGGYVANDWLTVDGVRLVRSPVHPDHRLP